MVEVIAEDLGIDSLIYQDLNDLVEAIGLPKEKLCTHCWDGSSCFQDFICFLETQSADLVPNNKDIYFLRRED